MKVIISTEPIRYPLTGVGRYTLELINHLQQLNQPDELLFFNRLKISRQLPVCSETPGTPRPWLNWLKQQNLVIDAFRVINPRVQGLALRGQRDAIYHGPNFYLPAGHRRCVTTFHDISTFTCPQFHPEARIRFMDQYLRASMKRASRIIAVSEFTRQEIVRHCQFPADRVDVTPLACGREFFPRDEAAVAELLARTGLRWRGFSLFIGSIEPRKNLDTLLNAYELLPLALRQRYPLILCGYRGWKSEGLHQRFLRAEQQGWLKYFGYLPQQDLPLLYAAARVFAFPSHYEGFGLPVLEAMASGTPVVCSSAASLPEIAGDAALLSDPLDAEALNLNLRRALEDDDWRQDAVARGLAQSQRFSWLRCAQDTLNVYRQVQD